MEDLEEISYLSSEYYINILNKYPSIIKWMHIYIMFKLIFLLYASILYTFHACQSLSYILFLIITGLLYIVLIKKESHPQQRLKIALFVTFITIFIMLNIIVDENKKTVCNVTVCHELDIFQENVNVVITAMKKDKNFCTEMSKSHKNNEEGFEDEYLGALNFIWNIFCRFYESFHLDSACQNEIKLDNVFVNYERLVIIVIYFISLLLFILIASEIILKMYHKQSEQAESQNIPLLEYYQKSSINQKDQNDTAIYLDNQIYNHQKYNNDILVNNNNNNINNNNNQNIYNPLDNITPDQSRVRKHDEQLSNQIKQQYNFSDK